MQIDDLRPAKGSTHRRKRVGRGIGSGHGKTCGRGTKGDKARGQVPLGFESGNTPLHRRLPQLRGFKSRNRVSYAVVNVADLESLDSGSRVDPQSLYEMGLLRDANERVKVLGDGELTKKLSVRAHKFSASAAAKIEAAGGTAEVL
jgi:large subunit ribosomal protein L15